MQEMMFLSSMLKELGDRVLAATIRDTKIRV